MTTTQQTVWPEGVIARYLTQAGLALSKEELTVTVTELGDRDATEHRYSMQTTARCGGCGQDETFPWDTRPYRQLSDTYEDITVREAAGGAEYRARRWAEKHAEKCRQLPRPDGA